MTRPRPDIPHPITPRPDTVEFRVLGCGDAFGTGGRFQSCFLVTDRHGTIAVDFGATSLVALRANGHDPHEIGHIVLTHFHGDHAGGLPFLLLDREHSARSEAPLCIAGPPGLCDRLPYLTEAMFPGAWQKRWRFPLELVEITPESAVMIGNRRLISRRVRHPTGPFDATALRLETCGRIIAFSGDTGWVDALLDISAGSDLFICECFDLDQQPYDGHLSLPVLLSKLPQIKARKILVNHLGPQMMARFDTLPVDCLTDGALYLL